MQHENRYEKILLVEDNDIDVELVKRITRRLGLDLPIVRARNGLEALEILKKPEQSKLLHPYLVLLDINMPLMDGFELLEHVSTYGPEIDVPIYMLSTSEAKIDRNKAEKYSVSGYLNTSRYMTWR